MQNTQVIPPAVPAYLQPGEIIADRYRLERELGRGSMGTVWSAVHLTLGQRVAIKVIATEHVESPEARVRFSNEAKAAARLKSRYVVQVYDDGQTSDGMPYIVMEHLEGETVESRLERTGALALAEAVRITTHVCRALSRAHAQGIVHRDLKPANIFLSRSDDDEHGWIAKVLDFGVAKLSGAGDASATKTGSLVGTPLFMSPEQVRGARHVDQRSDLYSLGMVFYNLVTGRFAFDSPSYSDVLIKICLEPLPDLGEVAPWISQPVRAWFGKACAREPAERFQSADEMAEALHQAVGRQYLDRGSIPDQVMGPSGTVVGYGSPDAAAVSTVVLDARPPAAQSGTAVLQHAAAPAAAAWVPPSQAAFSSASAHEAVGSLAVPGLPRRQTWPLFLAAGAGIGLAIAGGVLLWLLARSSARPASVTEAPEPNTTAASAAPAVAAAPLATSTPLPATSAAPAPTTSAETAAAPPPARAKAPRAATATRPATAPATRAPARKPAPKGGAPDIGF